MSGPPYRVQHHHAPQQKLLRMAAALIITVGVLSTVGCHTPGSRLTCGQRAVAEAARPILELDPNASWTECFNRLVDLGPESIHYLAQHESLARPAAPDDLRVMVHLSLLRCLANPAAAPPDLSATALETTLDVLHFDIKVGGREIGRIVQAEPSLPYRWHELYPVSFNHALAAQINVERDRVALLEWYAAHRNAPYTLAHGQRLRPELASLWRVLARGYADAWLYQPEPGAVLCAAGPPREPVLLQMQTWDYNLVRAVCIWLGQCMDVGVQAQLVELVGSPVPVVSYNARFALHYSNDKRIREILVKYE